MWTRDSVVDETVAATAACVDIRYDAACRYVR